MKTLRQPQARNWLTALMLWLTLIFFYGCFREYYRPKEKALDDVGSVLEQQPVAKYFIVHQGDRSYHLDQPALSDDYLLGQLEPLSPNHLFFAQTKPDRANRYRGPKEKHVLNEVHVWLKPEEAYDLGQAFREGRTVRLESQAIDRVEFYEMDHTATTGSHVIGAIGIGAVVTGFILAIAASSSGGSSSPPPSSPGSASSCPYAYLFDGSEFQLAGELFPGALLPNLERNDFLMLPGHKSLDGKQVVRLRNELKEIQYINYAELIAANHPEDYRVFTDPAGILYGVRQVNPALEAVTPSGRSALSSMIEPEDELAYSFLDFEADEPNLQLTFAKPQGAEEAKLVLRVRNTPWLELIWLAFSKKYGGYYESYFEKLGQQPAEEIRQWMADQNLLLTVDVRTPAGWEPREQLLMAGPAAFRDLVVRLDLPPTPTDEVQIRLRTGFQCWELDYAGLSFDEDPPIQVDYQPLQAAYANDGHDYLANLQAADSSYLVQARIGDQVDLVFGTTPVPEGQSQTLFLKSRGYYQPLRDFSGWPEWLSLRHFDRPGYFSIFSRQQFRSALAAAGVQWADDRITSKLR